MKGRCGPDPVHGCRNGGGTRSSVGLVVQPCAHRFLLRLLHKKKDCWNLEIKHLFLSALVDCSQRNSS